MRWLSDKIRWYDVEQLVNYHLNFKSYWDIDINTFGEKDFACIWFIQQITINEITTFRTTSN